MATETALDIINGGLQLLGVQDPNTPVASSDEELGLSVLNDLMDSWSNESLACFAWQTISFPLVPNQQSYTIGPGGNVNVNRPTQLPIGPGTAFIRDANNNDYPVDVVPQDTWNLIGQKDNTSDIPDTIFYDPQFPLGILNYFPVPITNYTGFIFANLQLSTFTDLASPVVLPPGYSRALKLNLAIELKPYYADGQLDPVIIKLAGDALGTVKRNNLKEVVALYDPEIVSRTSPTYNIYRDRSNGAN